MLHELIDAIGLEYMDKQLQRNTSFKDTLCIRVNKDNTLNVVYADKKDNMEDLEFKSWFSTRIYYSEYLTSNKAIIKTGSTSKMITSAVKQAVIFNMKTMVDKTKKNKLSMEEVFNMGIDEYMNKLKYEDSLIVKNKKSIYEILNKYTDKKIKVLILEDDNVENYKIEYDKYISENIFDKENGKATNRYTGFITLNDKKPLLLNFGGLCEEIQEYSKEEVSEIFTLNRYLSKFAKTKNEIELDHGGKIIFEYNPKEKRIVSYEYIPQTEENKYKLNILIENILGGKIEEYNIKNYNMLVDKFNQYSDFSFNTVNNDNNKDVLYYKYKNMIQAFWGKGEERQYTVDKEFINLNMLNIIKDIIAYNGKVNNSSDYKYLKLKDILNFEICVEDHFLKNNKKELVLSMREDMFERLKNYKETFEINDTKELAFITGQLAKYTIDKCGYVKTKNLLISKYHSVKNWSILKKHLNNDINKYGGGSRENKIYAEILYKITVLKEDKRIMTEDEKTWFNIGFYSDNIFYKKTK